MLTTKRKSVSRSTFLQLLKENYSINLLCQICKTNNFEHFHHIDENPGNNDPNNLLMVCAGCHAKEHSSSTKNCNIEYTSLDTFTMTLRTSEVDFKELLGYNNRTVLNGRKKVRVVRIRSDGSSNGRYIQVDFEILYKNKNGFYEKTKE